MRRVIDHMTTCVEYADLADLSWILFRRAHLVGARAPDEDVRLVSDTSRIKIIELESLVNADVALWRHVAAELPGRPSGLEQRSIFEDLVHLVESLELAIQKGCDAHNVGRLDVGAGDAGKDEPHHQPQHWTPALRILAASVAPANCMGWLAESSGEEATADTANHLGDSGIDAGGLGHVASTWFGNSWPKTWFD